MLQTVTSVGCFTQRRRDSQVVRQGSAKPLFVGSIPTRASKNLPLKTHSLTLESVACYACLVFTRFHPFYLIFALSRGGNRQKSGKGFCPFREHAFGPNPIDSYGFRVDASRVHMHILHNAP